MFKDLVRKKNGSLAAASVALLQGFEGLLLPLFGLIFTKVFCQSVGFSIATLAWKELLTLLVVVVIVGPKLFWNLLKKVIKNKDVRMFFHAGVWGTTLGNLFYIMAIQFGGSSYGVILTALYPIFSMLLIKFFTKEKEPWKVWMGVAIAVAGSFLFISLPIFIVGTDEFSPKMIIGIILGALAAFFWALEGLFINKGIRKDTNKDIHPNHAVLIRSMGTVTTSFIVLLPLGGLLSLIPSNEHIGNAYSAFAKLISHWEAFLILFAIAINLVILRKMHTYAISEIGAKLTAIIDANNFLVPPLFSTFLIKGKWHYVKDINKPNDIDYIYSTQVWWTWFLIIPILIGVMLVLIYHKESEEK